MGIFNLSKNKKFNYTPRHFKNEGNPFEIKHKFDEFRKTVGNNNSLKGKVKSALNEFKETPDRAVNRRILIIIALLILVFLFIIDFDLSIFFSNK
jgi:hypothetical protein